jgi:WD40 repeat protein
MPAISSQDFIDGYVYELERDFEQGGQSVSWAPGFTGPRKWGEEDAKLELPDKPTSALALSQDGTLLAVAHGRTIGIYDASTFELRRTLEGHIGRVSRVAFHPGRALLASSTLPHADSDTRDFTVRLWAIAETDPSFDHARCAVNIADRVTRVLFDGLQSEASWTAEDVEAEFKLDAVRQGLEELFVTSENRRDIRAGRSFGDSALASYGSYVFSGDGKALFYIYQRQTVVVYDVQVCQERFRLTEHKDAIMWIGDDPNSQVVATSSWDRTVRLWSLQTGSMLHCLEGSKGQNWVGQWSPDGKLIAVGSGDATVKVWDAQTGELLRSLEGFTGRVRALSFANTSIEDGDQADELHLAVGARHGTVRIFNMQSGRCVRLWQAGISKTYRNFLEIKELKYHVNASRSHTLAMFKNNDGRLIIHDTSRNVKWEMEQDLSSQKRAVYGSGSFVFVQDSQEIVSVDEDGVLRRWVLFKV